MRATPIPRLFRPALATAVAVLWAGACGDDIQGPPATEFLSSLIVSNPVPSGAAGVASLSSSGTSDGTVYASLPPGSFADGEQADLRTRGTGAETAVVMVDGGFDPIALAAAAGDTIDIRITFSGGGLLEYFTVVPPSRPPVVVRTDPPPQKRDVPLNAVMLVVFSEPISPAALSDSSAQLLVGGAPVAGTLRFADSDHLALTFTPAAPLTAGAEYTLVVTAAIQDLDGEALAQEVRSDFTTVTASTTPVFTQVSAGDDHTCGITTDSVAYCWGFNFYGQLGTFSVSVPGKTWLPTRVAGGLSFAQVSAGFERTCGVATDGAAYCWGWNVDGELGDGTLDDRHTPTPVAGGVTFARVSAGRAAVGSFLGGVATDGVAYCWPDCWGRGVGTQPAPVDSGVGFAQVSAGGSHACGVTTDGIAYCWGDNGDGEFGDGTIDSVGPRPGETPVAGDLTFAQLSAGQDYTCGVTTDDLAYCWGSALDGRLGDGTTDRRLAPTPVAGGLSFVQVSAGQIHTCGVTTDHVAYCWGDNRYGQLGDGTVDTRLTPTPVAGGLSFAQVTAGGSHTCGITTDDVVYCWGFNYSGQLGSRFGFGTMSTRLTPAPIAF